MQNEVYLVLIVIPQGQMVTSLLTARIALDILHINANHLSRDQMLTVNVILALSFDFKGASITMRHQK